MHSICNPESRAPLIFLVNVHMRLRLFVLLEKRSSDVFEIPWGVHIISLFAEQLYWHPSLPDPAQPFCRAARPDPPVVCPGFEFDRLFAGGSRFDRLNEDFSTTTVNHRENFEPVESKTRTYPRRVGTGRRTAGRRGRAGPGSTGCRRLDCSPRKKQVLLPPRR